MNSPSAPQEASDSSSTGSLSQPRRIVGRLSRYQIGTILFAGVFVVLFARIHAGFLALMLLPFFGCFWLYDGACMLRDRSQRRRRAARTLIWVLAFIIVFLMNVHWYRESRAYADQVAAAVVSYHAKTGAYPASLEDIGIHSGDRPPKWMLMYGLRDNQPLLFYAVPFMAFDTYNYDFETGTWQYDAD